MARSGEDPHSAPGDEERTRAEEELSGSSFTGLAPTVPGSTLREDPEKPHPASPAGSKSASREAEAIGRYVEVEEIGRGGMGQILCAVDPEIGRRVAIKRILGPREGSLRFLREARITGQLQHPNIPPIYELAHTAGGQHFFAMKLIEGKTLAASLGELRARRAPGELAAERLRLLQILLKVCDAVAYAHSRGVVHRDLKPQNIMLGEFGEVLVMDWGLARTRDAETAPFLGPEPQCTSECGASSLRQGEPALTVDGTVLGTPAYMSPEQARGDLGKVGPASDIYSLGAVLYEILALSPPFSGPDTNRVLRNVQSGRWKLPSKRFPRARIPRELEAVVERAMALCPEDRYVRVEDLRADLEAYLHGRTLAAARYSPLARLLKFLRRNWAASAVGISAILLLCATAAGWAWSLERRRREAEDAWRAEETARVAAQEAEKNAGFERDRARREETRSRRLLGRALEESAGGAAERGESGRASLLAARALEIEETPTRRSLALSALARAWERRALAPDGAFDTGALAVSPDGTRVALGDRVGWIHITDAISGREVAQERGEGRPVSILSFSPDGLRLAEVGEEEPVLRLRDGRTGKLLARCAGHSHTISAVCWTQDSGLLFSAGWDARVCVWNGSTGRLERVLAGPTESDLYYALDSTGDSRVAAGTGSGAILVWDLAASGEVRSLPGHTQAVFAISWSPDGRFLASGSVDGTIVVRDAESWEVRSPLEKGQPSAVTALDWAPAGGRFAAAMGDGSILVAEAHRAFAPLALEGHVEPVRKVKWSRDGSRLASLADDATVRVWDPRGRRPVAVLEGEEDQAIDLEWLGGDHPALVAVWNGGKVLSWRFDPAPVARALGSRSVAVIAARFSPDGGSIASASLSPAVRIWRPATGSLEASLEAGSGRILAIEWSPDGTRIASTTDDGHAYLWEPSSKALVADLPGHRDMVLVLAFSPDGATLATPAEKDEVLFWDPRTGDPAGRASAPIGTISHLAWSPDGDRLAAGGLGGTIVVWEQAGRARARVLGGPDALVRDLCWSGDGSFLASAHDDGTLSLWVGGRGPPTLLPVPEDLSAVTSLAWSPDGRILAGGSENGSIAFWDPGRGELLARLVLHSSSVSSIEFSPDGEILASSSYDRTVGFTNPRAASAIAAVAGHDSSLSIATWSPDGTTLASASDDGTVRLWEMGVILAKAHELEELAVKKTGLRLPREQGEE